MSFSFLPRSDDEIHAIQNRALLSDGIYPFIVKAIESQVSKSNNSMLKLKIGVIDAKGEERNIIDYLLGTDQMIYKLKHFCESIGMEDKYAKGNFEPQDCINRSGKVKIGVQKGAPKPDGDGFYPDKNSVKDYVKGDVEPKKAEKAEKAKDDFNDDIKF
jgi:hypothetical protein